MAPFQWLARQAPGWDLPFGMRWPARGRAMMRDVVRLMVASVFVLGVTGCTTVSYYAQSFGGHIKMMAARQDVARLIHDPSTPDELRARMAAASAIRQFATDELALPDNSSYRSYVDVGREAVTWAVFAAPEFSLSPKTWCFPVFGCVPYKGYFSRNAAMEVAADLREQGLDVHVAAITAYSTLGWSSDPLLSTMLAHDDTYLAGMVFHELAHQRVYINDDSAFNEAFAVAVETTGVRRWLRVSGDVAGLRRYEAGRKRRAEFLALVSQTRDELRHVYDGAGTATAKRASKAAAIRRLETCYRRMRDARWGGHRGYDAWFGDPINNARLAAVSVYTDQVAAFLRLFELCGSDYPRFYTAVGRLGALHKASRTEAVEVAATCESAGESHRRQRDQQATKRDPDEASLPQ